MKRVFSVALTVLLICLPLFTVDSFAAYNSELETRADIVLLVSLDDGTVIFDKNPDKITEAAALTKIVNLIVVLQNCQDLDAVITIPDNESLLLKKTYSSNAALKPGERFTVRQLLSCMMVKSANDAANVLADYIGGGSVDAFVEKMNAFAESVGCKNTHFANAHGLNEDGQYTTANDLLLMVKAGLELPDFLDICNEYKFNMPATDKTKERNYVSTNWMLNPGYKTYYYEYAQGIKTSTTSIDERSVVVKAAKDGYNYLAIVLDTPWEDVNEDGNKDNTALLEAKKLFKWTFKNIRLEKITDTTQIVKVVDVKLSFKTDHVRLVPKENINALVPSGTDSNSVLIEPIPENTPSVVYAPIKKGQVLGKARVLYADEQIATVDLVSAEDVSANIFLWILNLIKNIITSPIFIVAAVLAAGLIVAARLRRRRRLEEDGKVRYAPKMYKLQDSKRPSGKTNTAQRKKPSEASAKPRSGAPRSGSGGNRTARSTQRKPNGTNRRPPRR